MKVDLFAVYHSVIFINKKQISAQLVCSEIQVVEISHAFAVVLLANMIHQLTTRAQAESLFSLLMSKQVDANISANLATYLHTAWIKWIERGNEYAANALSLHHEHVLTAALNSYNHQQAKPIFEKAAASDLLGISSITLLGILKNTLIKEKGDHLSFLSILQQQLILFKTQPYQLLSFAGLGSLASFTQSAEQKFNHLQRLFKEQPAKDNKVRISRRWSKHWTLLLLIPIAVILFFLRQFYQDLSFDSNDKSQTPKEILAPKASNLSIIFDQGARPSVVALLASEQEKNHLLSILTQRFGADHFSAHISVNAKLQQAAWLSQLEALLALIAVSYAEFSIQGQNIELSGVLADKKFNQAPAIVQKIKSDLDDSFKIYFFNAQQAVSDARQAFRDSATTLRAKKNNQPCLLIELLNVLNLLVVDFSMRSAQIPPASLDDLDQSAELIKLCTLNSQHAILITAYTDTFGDLFGDAQEQRVLSEKRAQAIRYYLASKGVPETQLFSQGLGALKPIGDNATSSGRFVNRRLIFQPYTEEK